MSDDEKRESEEASRASTMRPPPFARKVPAAAPTAIPPVVPRPSALPPRPGATPHLPVRSTPVTPVRTAPPPNDRPTPRSTVIPRLPPPGPGKMRPQLETLIFHGAPPPPPPSPPRLQAAPRALRSFTPNGPESFEDVLSMELLEDDDESLPPGLEGDPGVARTDRPPPLSLRPLAPPPEVKAARLREPRIVAAIAGAIALPALLGIAAFALDRPAPRVSARAITAPPAVARAASVPAAACKVGGAARLLARRALVRGGVEATSLDDRIAFAALTSPKSGTAFELDAHSLTVKSSAKIVTADPLRHVVPALGDESPIEAEVDAAGLHTLADAEGESAVGARDGFVVWGPRDGDGMVRLWRLPAQQAVDAPRLGAFGTGGERALALRLSSGGGASEIRIGSFRGGQTTSELTRLSAPGIVGTPSLDTRGDEAIVAWAQRDKATSPWGVRWTRWAPQSGPAAIHQLTLPPGGPGDRAMAPTVSALGDGRVLLSWTEAGHGKNQVRAQVFDAADHPLGEALAISAEDAVAGQEQIALADDGQGAIAYLVARRGSFELRATAIDCATR